MNDLIGYFSKEIRDFLKAADSDGIQEIRMRVGQPVFLKIKGKEFMLGGDGITVSNEEASVSVSERQMNEFVQNICRYSPYAYEEEIRQGFLTLPGGHRVGLAGQIVRDENGNIKTMKHICSVNIRISHEIKGAANPLIPRIMKKDGQNIKNTLIISPPGCGKTTILRDIIRQLSNGIVGCAGLTVGVVDERSEIAASYLGIPQNDIGRRTDVLDSCSKEAGIRILIRAMAPQVIAVDEIGSREDFLAIKEAMTCGCKVLATVHGENMDDLRRKPGLESENERGLSLFDLYVVLTKKKGIPEIAYIYDREEGDASYRGRDIDYRRDFRIGNPLSKKVM